MWMKYKNISMCIPILYFAEGDFSRQINQNANTYQVVVLLSALIKSSRSYKEK
jgi:hypothetical protein